MNKIKGKVKEENLHEFIITYFDDNQEYVFKTIKAKNKAQARELLIKAKRGFNQLAISCDDDKLHLYFRLEMGNIKLHKD